MRRTPSIARRLAPLAAALLLAGCAAGQGATPRPTVDPSASPVVRTASDFCRVLDVLQSEHQVMREIRLRPGNRQALDDQYDEVAIAWDDVRLIAPAEMADQVDAMHWANIELGLAVLDYATSNRPEQAAEHMLRKDLAFHAALMRLRARTDCPDWAPTPRPERHASPSPDASASPSPSTPAASPTG